MQIAALTAAMPQAPRLVVQANASAPRRSVAPAPFAARPLKAGRKMHAKALNGAPPKPTPPKAVVPMCSPTLLDSPTPAVATQAAPTEGIFVPVMRPEDLPKGKQKITP